MYIIGVDGGGTKSRFSFVDFKGNEFEKIIGESTNLSSNSFETVLYNIGSAISVFLMKHPEKNIDSCAAVCIGSAGVDLPSNVVAMETILKEIGFTCPITVVNDSELVLWAEVQDAPGVALISGTGSIAFGKNKAGETARVGGHGHLLGDEGSGYWIGIEAIKSALKHHDGLGKETVLTELLLKKQNIKNIIEILDFVYHSNANKSDIAGLSVLVFEAAKANDEVAMNIIATAAMDLANMSLALIKKLEKGNTNTEYRIILSGGNAINSNLLYANIEKIIVEKQMNTFVSKALREPAYGAVYIALRSAGFEYITK